MFQIAKLVGMSDILRLLGNDMTVLCRMPYQADGPETDL